MLDITQDEHGCHLVVEGDMTIYQAETLGQALIPLLADERSIEVDLSAVSDMDTSGAQLLIMARNHRESRGLEFHLSRHSDAVLQVFERLGLTTWFHDSVVLSADRPAREGS